MIRDITSRNNHINPLLYVLVFLVVFFSNDTIMFGANINESYHRVGYCVELVLVLFFVFAYSFVFNRNVLFSKKIYALAIFMCLCVSLTAIVNADIRSGYLGYFFMLLLGVLFTERVPIKTFCKVFLCVFEFLALCSIVGWLITDMIPALRNIGYDVVKPTGLVFKSVVVYARSTQMPAAARNFSIFREPGVFQIYLNIALILALSDFGSYRKLRKWIGVVVIVVATLLTLSTSAYICMCLVFLLFVIRNGYLKEHRKFSFLIICLLLLLIGVLFYALIFGADSIGDILYDFLLSKFDKTSVKYDSGGSRLVSIETNLLLWLLNPVFGVGITQKQDMYYIIANQRFGFMPTSDTNTIMAMFSLFGFLMGTIFIVAILGLVSCFSRKLLERVILGIIIVVMLMTEYLVFSAICNIWIWYGLRLVLDKDYYGFVDLSVNNDAI